MKKIIFGLLVAFVALSFMGCPTTYEEYGYDIPSGYIIGLKGWNNPGDEIPMVYNEETAKLEYSFTADGVLDFSFIPTPGSWTGQLGFKNIADKGDLTVEETGAFGGNICVKDKCDVLIAVDVDAGEIYLSKK